MSNFDSAKDNAAHKAEETKGFGQQKAGEAQQATKVSDRLQAMFQICSSSVEFDSLPSHCEEGDQSIV